MSNRIYLDEVTEDEIRLLLAAKLRSSSLERQEYYHRSGRLKELTLESNPPNTELSPDKHTTDVGMSNQRILFKVKEYHISSILLVIEVLIFIGILYIGISGLGIHHGLNRAALIAQQLPPLTPTPLIADHVLPLSHVHTSLIGITQQDGEGIPKHLRPLTQAPLSVPEPTPTLAFLHGVRILIPAIYVDAPIVHGDGWEQLKKGVAHHDGSANPGQIGNLVLSGHNDIYGEVFRYLEKLKQGDKIVVYTSQRAYIYIVTGWELVQPSQVEVMDPTTTTTITLISCHPYLVDNHRIVVKGSLAE